MNFTLIQPGDPEFHKTMMKKHMEQKKRTQTSTLQPISYVQQNTKTATLSQHLPRAGQTVLNDSSQSKFAYTQFQHKKQVNQECEKMKRMLKSDMFQSMNQKQIKKIKEGEEQYKIKKVMSVENGPLDYLEKEISRRNQLIKNYVERQQIRNSSFIDEDKRKNKIIERHVLQNYDPNVFYYQAENYQKVQKNNLQKVVLTNNQQMDNLKASRLFEKAEYRRYLDPNYKKQKHNPITNPIQYHIENPYLQKKLTHY